MNNNNSQFWHYLTLKNLSFHLESKSSTSYRLNEMFLGPSFSASCMVAGPFRIIAPRIAAGRASVGFRVKASPEKIRDGGSKISAEYPVQPLTIASCTGFDS